MDALDTTSYHFDAHLLALQIFQVEQRRLRVRMNPACVFMNVETCVYEYRQ
jgi:hypothetical protein